MTPDNGKYILGNLSVYLLILLVLSLTACAPQTPAITATFHPVDISNAGVTASPTVSPVLPSPTPSATQPPPTHTPGPEVCSLLEGKTKPELSDMVVNPFAPPSQGSDDPHQGVDYAEIDSTYQIALEGLQVNAVLDGVVAGIVEDRFPYGNAILVETPLELLPVEWSAVLQIPTPAPPREGHPSLTCPESEYPSQWDLSRRSLYLIYAHFKEPPTFQIGEKIDCGQKLNSIGSSGNSLNPHVHLELRVGPSGARFESMAHYTGAASPQEMHNYCLWRVSETFQLLDPISLFSLGIK